MEPAAFGADLAMARGLTRSRSEADRLGTRLAKEAGLIETPTVAADTRTKDEITAAILAAAAQVRAEQDKEKTRGQDQRAERAVPEPAVEERQASARPAEADRDSLRMVPSEPVERQRGSARRDVLLPGQAPAHMDLPAANAEDRGLRRARALAPIAFSTPSAFETSNVFDAEEEYAMLHKAPRPAPTPQQQTEAQPHQPQQQPHQVPDQVGHLDAARAAAEELADLADPEKFREMFRMWQAALVRGEEPPDLRRELHRRAEAVATNASADPATREMAGEIVQHERQAVEQATKAHTHHRSR